MSNEVEHICPKCGSIKMGDPLFVSEAPPFCDTDLEDMVIRVKETI